MITIVGQDDAGRPLLGGIYDFTATHGVPLDSILAPVEDRSMAVSWVHYVHNAVAAGRSYRSVMVEIDSAGRQAFGVRWMNSGGMDIVESQLDRWLESQGYVKR